jgi:RimJ/RimL family protein N-acetyltransferase
MCILSTMPLTISFRPMTESDIPLLHDWLCRPHVAEWWGPAPSLADVRDEFSSYCSSDSPVRAYFVLGDGQPIGYIQSYIVMGAGDGWWTEEKDPGARGVDQFLANSEQLGQGLGMTMLRSFLGCLFEDPLVTKVQTDPSPNNHRAIRCYEKAGFRRVAEVDTPDGRALLMKCDRKSLRAITIT